jgi:hypothetical protein
MEEKEAEIKEMTKKVKQKIDSTVKFDDIIEKGEKIIKVYKPNKVKFALAVGITIFMNLIIPITILILALVLPDTAFNNESDTYYRPADYPDDNTAQTARTIMFIVSVVWLGILTIAALLPILYYKNKFYCYTDRRIIVRSGIFGVDYASLEFKSLTATMVQVSLLDKIIRKKTGTIKFGSASSQITGISQYGGGTNSPYAFRHIEKPYDVMREIKEKINKQS